MYTNVKNRWSELDLSKRIISIVLVIAIILSTVAIAGPFSFKAKAYETDSSVIDFGNAEVNYDTQLKDNGDGTYSLTLDLYSKVGIEDKSTSKSMSSDGYFEAPFTGNYLVKLWGGDGGAGAPSLVADSIAGGKGGYVYGILTLNKGDVLLYKIGGNGSTTIKEEEGGGANGDGGAHGEKGNFKVGGGGGYSAIYVFSGTKIYSGEKTEAQYFYEKYTDAEKNLIDIDNDDFEIDRTSRYQMIAAGGGGSGAGSGLINAIGSWLKGKERLAAGGIGGNMASGTAIQVDGGYVFAGADGQSSGDSLKYVGKGGSDVPGEANETLLSWSESTTKPNDWFATENVYLPGGRGGSGNFRGGAGGAGYTGGSGGIQTSQFSATNVGGGGGGASYISAAIYDKNNDKDYESIIENCKKNTDKPKTLTNNDGGCVSISFLGASASSTASDSWVNDITLDGEISKYFSIDSINVTVTDKAGAVTSLKEKDKDYGDYVSRDKDNKNKFSLGNAGVVNGSSAKYTITIKPIDDFPGGNDVPILVDNKIVAKAPENNTATKESVDILVNDDQAALKYVNVPFDFEAKGINNTIEKGDSLELTELYNNADVETINSLIQNDALYCFISKATEDKPQYTVTSGTIDSDTGKAKPDSTENYTVSFTVKPTKAAQIATVGTENPATGVTFSAQATVTVLNPGDIYIYKDDPDGYQKTLNVEKLLSYNESKDEYTLTVNLTGQKEYPYKTPEYTKKEYSYSNTSQTFTAPANGYYTIQAWGGSGANGGDCNASDSGTAFKGGTGAAGGYAYTVIYLNAGDTCSIVVGSNGTQPTATSGYAHRQDGGTGGGYSAVTINKTSTVALVAAGGGGGGGAGKTGSYHGAAGANATSNSNCDTATSITLSTSYNGGKGTAATGGSLTVNPTGGSAGSSPNSVKNTTVDKTSSVTNSDALTKISALATVTTQTAGYVKIELVQNDEQISDTEIRKDLAGITTTINISNYFTEVGKHTFEIQNNETDIEIDKTTVANKHIGKINAQYKITFSAKATFLGGYDVPVITEPITISQKIGDKEPSVVSLADNPATDYANVKIKDLTADIIATDKVITKGQTVNIVGKNDTTALFNIKSIGVTADNEFNKLDPILSCSNTSPTENTDYKLTYSLAPYAAKATKAVVGPEVVANSIVKNASVTVQYSVSVDNGNTSNVTITPSVSILSTTGTKSKTGLTAVLVADSGYNLPDNVDVKVNDAEFTNFEYDKTTGLLTIKNNEDGYITGNVTIAAKGVAKTFKTSYLYSVSTDNTQTREKGPYTGLKAGDSQKFEAPTDMPAAQFGYRYVWSVPEIVVGDKSVPMPMYCDGNPITPNADGTYSLPSTGTITYNMPMQDVSFIGSYQPISYQLKVNYVDVENGNAVLKTATYNDIRFGYVGTLDLESKISANDIVYRVANLEEASIALNINKSFVEAHDKGNDVLEINVGYKKATAELNIIYKDYSTSKVVGTYTKTIAENASYDLKEVIPEGIATLKDASYKTYYTPYFAVISGDTLTLLPMSANEIPSGKMDANGVTETVYLVPKKYEVTFEVNTKDTEGKSISGATCDGNLVVAYDGNFATSYASKDAFDSTLKNLPKAYKMGYNFLGWYADEEFTTPVNEETLVKNVIKDGKITLYAKWEKASYKLNIVHIDENGNVIYTDNDVYKWDGNKATVEYNYAGKAEYAKAIEGYTYSGLGYFTPAKGTTVTPTAGTVPAGSIEVTTPGNRNVYLSYTTNSYNLSYNLNGGSSTADTTASSVKYKTNVTVPASDTMTKSGFKFAGWYTDSAFSEKNNVSSGFTMPAANTVLYAKWIENGSIEVTVVDKNDKPIYKADVKLNGGTAVETNADGKVTFTGVSDGDLTISAKFGTHNAEIKPKYDGTNNSYTVKISDYSTTTTISGIVEDENNNPVKGAIVKLIDNSTDPATVIGTQVTGFNGTYEFKDVPEGDNYEIQITLPGSDTPIVLKPIKAENEKVTDGTKPVIAADYTDGSWSKEDVVITLSDSAQTLGDTTYKYYVWDETNEKWSDTAIPVTGNQITITETSKIKIVATSGSGEDAEEALELQVNIDKSGPELSAAFDPETGYVQKGEITIDASDDQSGITKLEFGTWDETEKKYIYEEIDNDSTKVENIDTNGKYAIRATNGSGIEKVSEVTVDRIDTATPNLSVSAKAGDSTYDNNWTNKDVVFTLTDSGDNKGKTSFYYMKDGDSDWTKITSTENKTATFTVNSSCETKYKFKAVSEAGVAGTASDEITVKVDKDKPTATIKIGESTLDKFEKFLETITFGLYTKTELHASATDKSDPEPGSGFDSVVYYVDNSVDAGSKYVTAADLDKITTWEDSATVPVTSEKNYVVYAKVTDKVGNYEYYTTDGLVVDLTAPVAAVTSKTDATTTLNSTTSIAYADRIVTITDAKSGVDTVTVYTVEGDTETLCTTLTHTGFVYDVPNDGNTYLFKTVDKVGNEGSYKIITATVDDFLNKVKTDNPGNISERIKEIEKFIKDETVDKNNLGNLTQEELDKLNTELEKLKGQKSDAESFINAYLLETGKTYPTDSSDVYNKAKNENTKQILSGESAWDALDDEEKAYVNFAIGASTYETEGTVSTYPDLLAKAKDINKSQDEIAEDFIKKYCSDGDKDPYDKKNDIFVGNETKEDKVLSGETVYNGYNSAVQDKIDELINTKQSDESTYDTDKDLYKDYPEMLADAKSELAKKKSDAETDLKDAAAAAIAAIKDGKEDDKLTKQEQDLIADITKDLNDALNELAKKNTNDEINTLVTNTKDGFDDNVAQDFVNDHCSNGDGDPYDEKNDPVDKDNADRVLGGKDEYKDLSENVKEKIKDLINNTNPGDEPYEDYPEMVEKAEETLQEEKNNAKKELDEKAKKAIESIRDGKPDEELSEKDKDLIKHVQEELQKANDMLDDKTDPKPDAIKDVEEIIKNTIDKFNNDMAQDFINEHASDGDGDPYDKKNDLINTKTKEDRVLSGDEEYKAFEDDAVRTKINNLINTQQADESTYDKDKDLYKDYPDMLAAAKTTLKESKEKAKEEIEKEKQEALKEIDELKNIPEEEREELKKEIEKKADEAEKKIDNSKTEEEVDKNKDDGKKNILDEVKKDAKKDIEKAEEKAKKEIENLKNLDKDEKDLAKKDIEEKAKAAKEEIDKKNNIEDIEEQKKTGEKNILDKVKEEAKKDIDKAAEKAKKEIDELDNLLPAEKEQAKSDIEKIVEEAKKNIDEDTTIEDIEQEKNDREKDILDKLKEKAKKEIEEEAEKAKTEINQLENLDEEEKQILRNKVDEEAEKAKNNIDNAKTPNEVTEEVTDGKDNINDKRDDAIADDFIKKYCSDYDGVYDKGNNPINKRDAEKIVGGSDIYDGLTDKVQSKIDERINKANDDGSETYPDYPTMLQAAKDLLKKLEDESMSTDIKEENDPGLIDVKGLDDLFDNPKAFDEDDQKIIDEGGKIVFQTVVVRESVTEISATESDALTDFFKEQNMKAAIYFNITLVKKTYEYNPATGEYTLISTEYLTDISDGMIEYTFEIPEEYWGMDEYYIVRVHDGKPEVIATAPKGSKTITVKTDKFSTYALTYKDPESNIKTLDDSPIASMSILLATSGVALFGFAKKKREEEEIED